MPLRDEIKQAQTEAMRTRETARLAVLRLIWSALRNEEIRTHAELTDDAIRDVIGKQIKQLRDARHDYAGAGRSDLVSKADQELEILQGFMPAQLSDAILEEKIKNILAAQALTGRENSGKAIGAVMKELRGQADGRRVQMIVERVLGVS